MNLLQELVNMQSAVAIMKGLSKQLGEDLKSDSFNLNVIKNFEKIEFELNQQLLREVEKNANKGSETGDNNK